MRQVQISHNYAASARDVWDVATDFDCFVRSMQGVATFRALPSEPLHQGQVIETDVSLFGRLPWRPHRMELVLFDPDAMTFVSNETGPGIRYWNHHLAVEPTGTGCNLIDTIDIEGDPKFTTLVLAAWARFVYKKRHQPRLEMLAERKVLDGQS